MWVAVKILNIHGCDICQEDEQLTSSQLLKKTTCLESLLLADWKVLQEKKYLQIRKVSIFKNW